MVIEKLHPEDPDNSGEQRHKPEVIFPDEEYEQSQEKLRQEMDAIRIRSSLALRMMMLVVGLVSLLVLAFNLLVLVAHTILILATFLRSPVFVEVWRRTVRAVKRWMVISLGSFLAVFFPTIGITFMLSYFFISSDEKRQQFFMSMLGGHMQGGGPENRNNGNGPFWS